MDRIIRSEAGEKDDNHWDISSGSHSVQIRQKSMLLLNRCSLSSNHNAHASIHPCRNKITVNGNNNKIIMVILDFKKGYYNKM